MKNLLVFLLIVLASCKTSEISFNKEMIKQVETILGSDYQKTDNGIYSLCVSERDLENNRNTFLVVNMKDNSIVYGPEKINAKIEWHSETVLKIRTFPEVIQDKNSTDISIYYYNIITKKKTDSINPAK